MAYPFRAPRTITEMMQMADAAEALRAAGRVDAADAVEAAIRSVSFDPESVAVSRMLQRFDPPVAPEPRSSLNSLDAMAAPEPVSFPGHAGNTPYDKANRSFMGIESGRTMNLRNQNTDLNRIRQDDILTAAQDSIRGQQEALASENLGRAAATAGVGGLAAMIAESAGRMTPSPAGIGDMESVAEAPELAPAPRVEDIVLPDVPIDTPEAMDPPDMYAVKNIARDLPLEQLDLLNDDPMATADLVEESRPIPASTPRLTPEEIEALRSQVVAIRDAKTGEAMDSFYPPESEEYKAEQRMKKMYPQLRRR